MADMKTQTLSLEKREGREHWQGAGRLNGQCPEYGGRCTLKRCRKTTEHGRFEGLVHRNGVQVDDVSTIELWSSSSCK